jgi:HEAT repeat protein
MGSPSRKLLLAAAAALAASCGSAGPEPELPGFEGLESDSVRPRVDRAPAAPPSARPPAATREPLLGDPEALRVGAVIQESDVHLRAWSRKMAEPRDAKNQEEVRTLAYALGAHVAKNRAVLEDQCIGGPPRNRGIAAAALGFAGDPGVLPLLMNCVADPDPGIAAKGLLAVGVLAAPETPIAPIHAAVLRPDAAETVIQNAAFALFQLAERTRADPDGGMESAFVELLRSPDALVRAQSALGLGLVRAAAAVPPITDLLAADPVPAVRTAAAWSLGLIGLPGSTAPLVRALADPDAVTAGTARGALTRIHGRDLGPTAAAWAQVEAP